MVPAALGSARGIEFENVPFNFEENATSRTCVAALANVYDGTMET